MNECENVRRSYSSIVGISSEVLCVQLGVYLPLIALVVHRVLQAVPAFFIGGVPARVVVPRAPVLVQVLESGQFSIIGCVRARVCIPIKVVLSRPLQQPYTPPHSSVVAYVFRSFTKKSKDSLGTALDSFVTPKPSPPGTPTETPPAHKRLGSVRAFLARSGELLERLTADGAEEELVEDGKAGEMEEVREVKPAGPSDSPRNRAGSILDVPPKKRRRVHAPTFEPGCARARPFVRRGDVGDEDVAVYRPDPDFDANEVKIPGGDVHAWRWSTEQRSAVSPPNLLHDTSNVKTREVQRLMLPCVVASTRNGGDSMDAKRRAASSAAMNSTFGPPVSPVGSASVSPTTADERVAERRRLRSDTTRVLSASSPAGSPSQPFSQPFLQQPL